MYRARNASGASGNETRPLGAGPEWLRGLCVLRVLKAERALAQEEPSGRRPFFFVSSPAVPLFSLPELMGVKPCSPQRFFYSHFLSCVFLPPAVLLFDFC